MDTVQPNEKKISTPLLILGAVALYIILFRGIYIVPGILSFFLVGQNPVMNVPSPDGEFIAYAREEPILDGPNQTLLIERRNKLNFVIIADLVEDVDSIQDIHWSPDSDLVVFLTYDNIIAVHVPGYESVKIPLHAEFTRRKPQRISTWSGGRPLNTVAAVEFPESGVFSYQFEDSYEVHTIRLFELLNISP
jgi:hypothetical protein